MNYKVQALLEIMCAMAIIYLGRQMLAEGKQKLLG